MSRLEKRLLAQKEANDRQLFGTERERARLQEQNRKRTLRELEAKIRRLLNRLEELGGPDAEYVKVGHGQTREYVGWTLYTHSKWIRDSESTHCVRLLANGRIHYADDGRIRRIDDSEVNIDKISDGVDRLIAKYGA